MSSPSKLDIFKKFFLLIAVFILIYYLYKNHHELSQLTYSIDYKFLTISFLLLLIAFAVAPLVWYLITKNLGCSLGFKETLRIRVISEIGKYIPGASLDMAILLFIIKTLIRIKLEYLTVLFMNYIYQLYQPFCFLL